MVNPCMYLVGVKVGAHYGRIHYRRIHKEGTHYRYVYNGCLYNEISHNRCLYNGYNHIAYYVHYGCV